VKCQCWQKESIVLKFFAFISRSGTTHIASFSFPHSCFGAAQIVKISLHVLTVASLDNHLVLIIIIIMVFYYGLMVHITDTRAQKVVSYTSAHITETVFAHDQHWEEQSTLSSPQLYRHSQEHRKWTNIQQRITQPVLVRVQPWEGQNTFPALLFFAWCVHSIHIFLLHKSNTDEKQILKQLTNDHCIWSPPYRSVE